jgi:signal transduction histidine kinase
MREARKNRASSDSSLSKRRIVLLGLLIYLGGLLVGTAFILAIPCLNNRENLLELAVEQTESVLDTYTPSDGPTFGTEFYLISEDENIIFSITEFLHPSEQEKLFDFARMTFAKEPLYCLRVLRMGDDDPGKPTLCIVCGVVRESRAGLPFAGILLRDLKDLDISLETFSGIYTLIFLTAAWLIAYFAREQRDLNRMRRDLVANVSHELKTPITSIKAIAEILHDGMADSPQEIHRYSASILAETDNLEDMVLEILELSRLQSRHIEVKKDKIYADGLLQPLIDRYMMLCTDLGVRFEWTEPDCDIIPPLYTDREMITKVLSVLLDNAIKFTGKDGLVSLNLAPGKGLLTVSVKDNGPGIKAEDLDHIFDRFYKADVTHNTKGSGLGLAIAHETSRALGEKLWVESTYGAGSEFFCTIHYYK